MRGLLPKIPGFVVVAALLSLPAACNLFVQGGGDGNTNGNDNGNTNINDDGSANANDNDIDNGGDVNPDLALFTDPDTGFSTTVVHDVDTDTVQFSISGKSILYQDGTEYQAGSWTAEGNFLADGGFQIRFGTEVGERKAYFTETAPGTICNFVVTADQFQIFPTTVTPPQE